MDAHELRSRPSGNTSPPFSSETQDNTADAFASKGREDFRLLCPFSLPPTPEAAVVRIVRNVAYFWLLYTLVLWIGLSISLIPERKLSLLFLVATSAVASSYLLLMRLLPDSSLLHRFVDRRLVVAALAVVAGVGLVMTLAGKHLGITMAIGTPIVLVHALMRAREDLCLNEEALNPGELFFLVEKKPKETEYDLLSSTEEV
ncbi:hypothetical protein SAY87_025291 [Trapa incisa]|uniref:PRA1 family protein n=1 Tax=Trapa incisa TaxID=236973 RepID=A0AAN7GDF4_9MYRT|nr:hypothetical protein SAY87_025291 [Trapa incisa]